MLIDTSIAAKVSSGFAINTWDALDVPRHDQALKELADCIAGGWQVASHTTVVFGKQVIQTVILVKYENNIQT